MEIKKKKKTCSHTGHKTVNIPMSRNFVSLWLVN